MDFRKSKWLPKSELLTTILESEVGFPRLTRPATAEGRDENLPRPKIAFIQGEQNAVHLAARGLGNGSRSGEGRYHFSGIKAFFMGLIGGFSP